MARLRSPDSGCPWDLKQTYKSILPYTIEEVYEVADAIEREDYLDLKDELGDLLFQVVFYSQLATEDGFFELDDVIDAISDKLTRRHPHVFSNQEYTDESDIHRAWEEQKHKERETKSSTNQASLLDDIPNVMPELKRAQKIQKRVAKKGFDWPHVDKVWEKLDEEILEVREAIETRDNDSIEDEIGDLLFVCVNLARHLKVDADIALRKANQKFDKRFRSVEKLAKGKIENFEIDELEAFWQQAKRDLKK